MGSRLFRRAYQKFKGVIAMYAFVDYREAKDTPVQLSWAWEDAFVAFRGYGEETMTGPILQMWTTLPSSQESSFRGAIENSFQKAVQKNPSYPKRYKDLHRLAPVRTLDDGFNLAAVLPDRSPSLKDWGVDNGLTALELDEYFSLVDETVSMTAPPEDPSEPPPKKPKTRPPLRLIK
jgi:hypothetical protein